MHVVLTHSDDKRFTIIMKQNAKIFDDTTDARAKWRLSIYQSEYFPSDFLFTFFTKFMYYFREESNASHLTT